MFEKLEQGLRPSEMMGFFPDRTYASVNGHTQRLGAWNSGRRDKLKTDSDPLIQRIIDMRVKEAKYCQEIASELGIKYGKVFNLWETRCVKMLSKEMLDQVYVRNNWSPNEIEHLYELHRRATLCSRDAALHFPSRTLKAVKTKASHLQIRFPGRPKKPEVSVAIKSEESLEQ